jgi:protein-tyrosine-phosphatase
MTAKEKAEELVNKFDYIIYTDEDHNNQVRKCALLAVDEIIDECLNWSGGSIYSGWDTNRFDYLEEVKQEIKKL